MITNQKLKKSLEEIKNITSFDAILYSAKGKHLTGTVEEPEHSDIFVKEFIVSEDDVREKNDAIAFAVEIDSELEYVLVMFCPYTSENLVIGRMAVCQLRTLVLGESERYDRNNFIQNILLGNMLGSDIINRAKKLHIENRKRVVYVIDTGKNSNEIAVELVKNLADIRSGDFVVAMDEHNVVLVKDVEDIDSPKLQEKLSSIAGSLVDNLLAEAMIKVRVGYGNPMDVLPKIAESYQEAKMALEVGRLFYVEKEITDRTFTGTPVDFPPLEKACRSLLFTRRSNVMFLTFKGVDSAYSIQERQHDLFPQNFFDRIFRLACLCPAGLRQPQPPCIRRFVQAFGCI